MSEFSNLLNVSIESFGLTQAAVEKRTGIDRTVLSKLMSGAIPPSTANLKALVEKLSPGKPLGLELMCAYLRDLVVELGIKPEVVSIRLRDQQGNDSAWWQELSEVRSARLRSIEMAASVDEVFNQLISDLEPLALKYKGALADADELKKFKLASVYPFPKGKAAKVAEPKGKWPGAPGGASQVPPA